MSSCPHAYCTSNICYRYTAEDRAQAKALALTALRAGEQLRGEAHAGATFLAEDGEAQIVYNTAIGRAEIVLPRRLR